MGLWPSQQYWVFYLLAIYLKNEKASHLSQK